MGGHHAELAGGDELSQGLDLLLQEGGVSSLFASVYGSAGLLPVSVLEKEEDMLIE